MTLKALFLLGPLLTTAAAPPPTKAQIEYAKQMADYRKQMAQTIDTFDGQIAQIIKEAIADPEHGTQRCSLMEGNIDSFLMQFNFAQNRGGFGPTDTFPTKAGNLTADGVRKHLAVEKKQLQDQAIKSGNAKAKQERLVALEMSFDWQQRSTESLPVIHKQFGQQRTEYATAQAIVGEAARFEKWAREATALKVVTDATPLKTKGGPMKLTAMLAESKKMGADAAATVARIDESNRKFRAKYAEMHARNQAFLAQQAANRAAAPARTYAPPAEVSSPLQEQAGEPAVETPAEEPAAEEAAPESKPAEAAAAAPEPAAPRCLGSGAVCGDKNHPDDVCCSGLTCAGREPIYSDGELGFGSCR